MRNMTHHKEPGLHRVALNRQLAKQIQDIIQLRRHHLRKRRQSPTQLIMIRSRLSQYIHSPLDKRRQEIRNMNLRQTRLSVPEQLANRGQYANRYLIFLILYDFLRLLQQPCRQDLVNQRHNHLLRSRSPCPQHLLPHRCDVRTLRLLLVAQINRLKDSRIERKMQSFTSTAS